MADTNSLECFATDGGKLERLRYFDNQLLTADDLSADQEYFRALLRRHNRFLHGWGVVCGLEVTAAPTSELPWQVRVDQGYALGPHGHEIFVGAAVHLDLARCGPGAATDPCEPGLVRTPAKTEGALIYVAVRFAECVARPVRALPDGCTCDERACEYSRIRDSFQLECLTELPPSHQPPSPGPSVCDVVNGIALTPCLPCPEEPWVVLARVTLPESPSQALQPGDLDNFSFRRQIFSTAVLQEQLIACCCGDEEPPPAEDEEADLALTKNSDVAGPVISYVLTVINNGPTIARNVVVDDSPPSGTASNFATSQGSWTQTVSPPFRAELGDLLPGQSVTLTFDLEAPDEGVYTNTASVSSDTPDPNLSNNQATAEEILIF